MVHPKHALALSIAFLLVGTTVSVITTDAPDASEPKSVWRTDLRPCGLTHHSLGMFMFQSHDRPMSSTNQHLVAINSTGQVAVVFAAFLERNGDGYEPGTAKLHLLSFDSSTGKQIGAVEWPAPDAQSIVDTPELSATGNGDFLLRYAGQLTLYAPTLHVIRSASIESTRPHFSYWTSPDGRYAFFSGQKDKINVLTIVDTETLQVVRSLNLDQPIAGASSRYTVAWSARAFRDPTPRSLNIRSSESGWQEIYSDSGCPDRLSAAVGFLTDAELIVSDCNKLLILSSDKQILFSQTFSKRETLDHAHYGFYPTGQISFSSSADGQRFAVALDHPKRDPWWLGDPGTGPVPQRLLIYDLPSSASPIASFELHGSYPTDYDRLSFTLASDGMSLALIRDTKLEFFRLSSRPAH
jgi:hypothetical protein